MENEDKESLLEIAKRGIDAVDRLSSGIEKLLEEPMVEIDPAPPSCPHCKDINPMIRVEPSDQAISGQIAEFVLIATCGKCKKELYGICNSWVIFPDKKSARVQGQIVIERMLGK